MRLSSDVQLDWVGRVDGAVTVVIDGRDRGRELLSEVADVVWAARRDARLLGDWLHVEPGRGLRIFVVVDEQRPQVLRRLQQLPVELLEYRWVEAPGGSRHAALVPERGMQAEAASTQAVVGPSAEQSQAATPRADQPPAWLGTWGRAVRRIDPELVPRACAGGFEGPLRGISLYTLQPREGEWWVRVSEREWRLDPSDLSAPLEALMAAYLQHGPSAEPLTGVEDLPELEVLLANHLPESPVYQLPRPGAPEEQHPNEDQPAPEPSSGLVSDGLLTQEELDSLQGGA